MSRPTFWTLHSGLILKVINHKSMRSISIHPQCPSVNQFNPYLELHQQPIKTPAFELVCGGAIPLLIGYRFNAMQNLQYSFDILNQTNCSLNTQYKEVQYKENIFSLDCCHVRMMMKTELHWM